LSYKIKFINNVIICLGDDLISRGHLALDEEKEKCGGESMNNIMTF